MSNMALEVAIKAIIAVGVLTVAAMAIYSRAYRKNATGDKEVENIIGWSMRMFVACVFITLCALLSYVYSTVNLLDEIKEAKNCAVECAEEIFENNQVRELYAELLHELISGIMTIAIFTIVCTIMYTIIKKKTPFCQSIAKRIRIIGVVIITGSLVVYAVIYVVSIVIQNEWFELVSLISWSQILFGLLMCLCGYIFEYGSRLQRTEDEMI